MSIVTCRSTDALAGLGALHAHRGPSTGRTTACVHVFEARMRSALTDSGLYVSPRAFSVRST